MSCLINTLADGAEGLHFSAIYLVSNAPSYVLLVLLSIAACLCSMSIVVRSFLHLLLLPFFLKPLLPLMVALPFLEPLFPNTCSTEAHM